MEVPHREYSDPGWVFAHREAFKAIHERMQIEPRAEPEALRAAFESVSRLTSTACSACGLSRSDATVGISQKAKKEAVVHRRAFLFTVATGATTVLTACRIAADEQVVHKAGDQQFEIMKTENQWKQALTKEQFQVLRKHATERPGSSPLNGEHRTGTYHCAGCDLPVYSSATKFESGTGWPSFTAPLANGVGTAVDRSFFATRTEVHCRRCGGHLGHVFDDGPEPTGKRYCMNGAALSFRPASQGV